MQATRLQIVEYLKKHGRASVQELAEAAGLTPMTIRHHLNILESEGYVRCEKERGHVGRPRYQYFLTENALSLFPERYNQLAGRLLQGLKELGARQELTHLFERMASDIIDKYRSELTGKSLEERLRVLINILQEEGFLASWEKAGDQYLITEYSCPYLLVGQEHPEICQVDQKVITTILGTPAEKQSCMLDGDCNCTFVIHPTF